MTPRIGPTQHLPRLRASPRVFAPSLASRGEVGDAGCAAARAWAQPLQTSRTWGPTAGPVPVELCPRLPKPWQLQLKALFLPKAYFFLNRFSCKTHQPPVKAVWSTDCAMQACVNPRPFPSPPLFCPQTANNLFFTMTREGRGCPGDAGSKLGSFRVPKCRAEDDFHLPREEMKESKGITLKLNSPNPKCPGHKDSSSKPFVHWVLSSKGVHSRARGGCSQPCGNSSRAPRKVVPLTRFPPHPNFCTNRRCMTPCKEKQLFWKSSALSLCLISPHPTRVSMEAEEGAGSLRLQIAASSPPAPEPEETNRSLKIKQDQHLKKRPFR